jgi:Bacterial extracellular solute-binding proteins, family 3
MHHGLIFGSAAIAILATLIAQGTSHRTDAASLAEVLQNGILRLCANPSALPYSNLTDRGGLAGFKVELAEVLAHEMGFELGVTWVRNAGDIKNSDCDVLMGVVASAASYDREGLTGPLTTHLPLRYSRPYADSGVVLVISSRSSVRRLEDLHGQKIGVMVVRARVAGQKRLPRFGLRLSRRHNCRDRDGRNRSRRHKPSDCRLVSARTPQHGSKDTRRIRARTDTALECFSRASPSGRCAACSRGCCGVTSCRAADTSADLREVWHSLSTPFRRRSKVRDAKLLVRLNTTPTAPSSRCKKG